MSNKNNLTQLSQLFYISMVYCFSNLTETNNFFLAIYEEGRAEKLLKHIHTHSINLMWSFFILV